MPTSCTGWTVLWSIWVCLIWTALAGSTSWRVFCTSLLAWSFTRTRSSGHNGPQLRPWRKPAKPLPPLRRPWSQKLTPPKILRLLRLWWVDRHRLCSVKSADSDWQNRNIYRQSGLDLWAIYSFLFLPRATHCVVSRRPFSFSRCMLQTDNRLVRPSAATTMVGVPTCASRCCLVPPAHVPVGWCRKAPDVLQLLSLHFQVTVRKCFQCFLHYWCSCSGSCTF